MLLPAARTFAASLIAGVLLAGVAVAQSALPEDVLFRGARLGMARPDLLKLPVFGETKPDCWHTILVGQPRNTRVGVCSHVRKTPSGKDITTTYTLSADPSQIERIINVAVRGEAGDADWALSYLKARFGSPSYEAVRRQLGADGRPQRATVWQIAGRQVMFRAQCKTTVTFCVDYSDSPFARQISQQLGEI